MAKKTLLRFIITVFVIVALVGWTEEFVPERIATPLVGTISFLALIYVGWLIHKARSEARDKLLHASPQSSMNSNRIGSNYPRKPIV